MNKRQRQKAEEGLNGIAWKVYDAISPDHPMRLAEINGAVQENGSRVAYNVLLAIVDDLMKRKLVLEMSPCRYQRRFEKEEPEALTHDNDQQEETMATSQPAAPTNGKPTEKLFYLSTKLREHAAHLIKLADEFDNAGLEIEQALDAVNSKQSDLAQLSSLLKKLGA